MFHRFDGLTFGQVRGSASAIASYLAVGGSVIVGKYKTWDYSALNTKEIL